MFTLANKSTRAAAACARKITRLYKYQYTGAPSARASTPGS